MRIGYRLRDITLPANRGAELTFRMERVPPILERVRVSDKEVCPGSEDRGSAFQLWDQARTGLLATIVAREAKPATATTVVYERAMSGSDEIVRKQTTRVSHGRTTRPFIASAEPAVFARVGYMMEDSRGRIFNAPDADVLLHESFALTHCFRLRAADAAHRGQIGVAFAPAPGPGRDTIVDVAGVIWMDADSPQLRTLDFTYTALEPAAVAAHAGGHIEFRSMSNGASFIERWVLRLPTLQLVETALPGSATMARSTRRTPRSQRQDARVQQINETGGIVVQAEWDDGLEWKDSVSIVAGLVKGRRTGAAVPDAVVFLEGTSDSTTTDVNGEFDIPAIPGRYFLRVADTAFKDFTKERTASQLVSVTRGAIEMVRIELPPAGDVLEDVCRGRQLNAGSLLVAGYLATVDASPLEGARIRAAWNDVVMHPVNGRANVPVTRTLDVNEEGRFVICGVPPLRPVQVELLKDKTKIADTTFTLVTLATTQRFLWVVPPLGAPRVAASRPAVVAPPRDSAPPSPMSASDKLKVFQTHAATQLGTYLTDSALAIGRGKPLVDVLPQLVNTLRVWRVDDRAFVVAPSRTTNIPGFQSASRCVSDVYVDGAQQYSAARYGRVPPPDLSSYSTDAIAAVEYYAADTRVPDGLRASPCGVLLLWTRP
jgi:hypothetical protein